MLQRGTIACCIPMKKSCQWAAGRKAASLPPPQLLGFDHATVFWQGGRRDPMVQRTHFSGPFNMADPADLRLADLAPLQKVYSGALWHVNFRRRDIQHCFWLTHGLWATEKGVASRQPVHGPTTMIFNISILWISISKHNAPCAYRFILRSTIYVKIVEPTGLHCM